MGRRVFRVLTLAKQRNARGKKVLSDIVRGQIQQGPSVFTDLFVEDETHVRTWGNANLVETFFWSKK